MVWVNQFENLLLVEQQDNQGDHDEEEEDHGGNETGDLDRTFSTIYQNTGWTERL